MAELSKKDEINISLKKLTVKTTKNLNKNLSR